MASVRIALALSMAQTYASLVITLLSSMAIARILKPEEIGVFSVTVAVVGIAQALRDFGIGNYLIQKVEINRDHIRTAFGVALTIGLALFGVIWAATPWAADFYDEPRLVETIHISSLNFLLVPLSIVPMALMRRDMQFQRILPITIAALLANATTSILCALEGLGPNSLAIGTVVGNLVVLIGTVVARRADAFIMPSLRKWRSVFGFGSKTSVLGILGIISTSANDLIIGKFLGFYSVAIVSRAEGMMNMIGRDMLAGVKGVALPAFAEARRKQHDLDFAYTRSVAIVTVIAWPLFGVMALFPLEALRIIFGDQWDDAVPLVAIFCLSGSILAVHPFWGEFMVGLGRIDLLMRSQLIVQPLRLGLLVCAVLVFGSMESAAFAHLVSSVLAVMVISRFRSRALSVDLGRFYAQLKSSFLVSAVALVPVLALVADRGFVRHEPIEFGWLMLAGMLSVVVWFVAARLFRHPVADEALFQRIARFGRPA